MPRCLLTVVNMSDEGPSREPWEASAQLFKAPDVAHTATYLTARVKAVQMAQRMAVAFQRANALVNDTTGPYELKVKAWSLVIDSLTETKSGTGGKKTMVLRESSTWPAAFKSLEELCQSLEDQLATTQPPSGPFAGSSSGSPIGRAATPESVTSSSRQRASSAALSSKKRAPSETSSQDFFEELYGDFKGEELQPHQYKKRTILSKMPAPLSTGIYSKISLARAPLAPRAYRFMPFARD